MLLGFGEIAGQIMGIAQVIQQHRRARVAVQGCGIVHDGVRILSARVSHHAERVVGPPAGAVQLDSAFQMQLRRVGLGH